MANLPMGRYLVKLPGIQGFSLTSNGNTQFFMKFQVLCIWNNENAQWDTIDPVERTWYKVITEKSAEYAAEDLRALGFAGDKFSQLDPRHPQRHIFRGEVEMTCAIEVYDNKPREKWNVVREGGEREEKIVDSAAVKKLDMIFGKTLGSVPVTAKAQVTQAPRNVPLVSQPRQKQHVPDAVTDPATGYAMEPQPAMAGPAPSRYDTGIDDSDVPF